MLLLFPGRDLIHLVWVTTPLIFLAAYILSKQFSVQSNEIVPSLGITSLVVIIVLFLWQIFGRLSAGYLEMQLFWFALGGGIAILLLSALLAMFGWSLRIALAGYTWGFLAILLLWMIMSTFHSIKPAEPIRGEMWNNEISHPDQALLIQTIEETSGWSSGNPIGLDIQVVGTLSPSLEWALRHHDHVQRVNAVSPGDQPDIVISTVDDQPELAQQYRGQDFFLQSRVKFEAFQSEDWFRWIMLRKTTVVEQHPVILWIRSDLFPGGISNPDIIQ